MNVKTKISSKCYLEKETQAYLKDAGFQEYMYEIECYNDRQYIRVFMSEKGIDFILKDIKKTYWNHKLEITKYKKNENCSAVFIFK